MATKKNMDIPLRVRITFWLRRWVYLLWLLLLPLAWLLQPEHQVENPLLGLVSSDSETVGPIETVRIRKILVSVGQEVDIGDTLVEVDGFAETQEMNDLLNYRLRSAELKLDLAREAQEQNAFTFRLQSALEDSRVALEETLLNQKRDQAAFDSLKAEMDRLSPLVEKRLISELELSRIRPELKALELTLTGYPALLKAQQERLALAQKAWDDWMEKSAKQLTNSVAMTEYQDVQRLLKETAVEEQGQIAYLKAKSKGVVSRIQFKAGDVVSAGVPILRIMRPDQIEITGLLKPHQAAMIEEGLLFKVVVPFREVPRRYTARVVRMEPELLDLMDPFSTPSSVRYPTRGRRMYLAIEEKTHDLIPGESVLLTFPQLTFKERCRRFCRQVEARFNRLK